jgi:hypothetical protein
MAKTWVLETHTKGTGANIVPLEEGAAPVPPEPSEREPLYVPRKPAPRPAPEPARKAPSRFKVVEVTTGRVLAEDAGVRATVELLREVPSITDVAIWIWSERHGRYVLLTHREQRRLWELREAVRPAAGSSA